MDQWIKKICVCMCARVYTHSGVLLSRRKQKQCWIVYPQLSRTDFKVLTATL